MLRNMELNVSFLSRCAYLATRPVYYGLVTNYQVVSLNVPLLCESKCVIFIRTCNTCIELIRIRVRSHYLGLLGHWYKIVLKIRLISVLQIYKQNRQVKQIE